MQRRNLKGERVKAGFSSAEEFSKALGVSKNSVNMIENGRRNGTYETWIKIQEVLQLDNSQMWDLYLKQG